MPRLRFHCLQIVKQICHKFVFPAFYCACRVLAVEKGLIVFADAHSRTMPSAMKRLYQALSRRGDCKIRCCFIDGAQASALSLTCFYLHFIHLYAQAHGVVLRDYFLPVSSCPKREKTVVIQLWHGYGLFKKIGCDASEDMPRGAPSSPMRYCNLVTVSADLCIPYYARAWNADPKKISALGVSQTDFYFDQAFIQRARENFFRNYPDMQGKKILLWAPTFRGNAACPEPQPGLAEMRELENKLSPPWKMLIRLHSHAREKEENQWSRQPLEELLPLVDLLITDYSSILFDFAFFSKPVIFFMPDLSRYLAQRGLYISPRELPGPIVTDPAKLPQYISQAEAGFDSERMTAFRNKYAQACDGRSTERIMAFLCGEMFKTNK